MGRVLGGGSSVNALIWARGHKNDWDFFAAEANSKAWNYESVLAIYRRIEDWHGVPDPKRRGKAGLLFVQLPLILIPLPLRCSKGRVHLQFKGSTMPTDV